MAKAELYQFNQQRGPCLKLLYSFCGFYNGDTLFSEKYCIDDLAEVSFKFEHRWINNAFNHKVSTAFKKHQSAEGSTVKIQITSGMDNICKEWVCSELQNDWLCLYDSEAKLINDRYYTQIEITVLVTAVKTISFANLYDDTDLVDFYLKTENSSVGVHKTCLAAHSEVFKAMLTGEWKEKNKGFIKIEETTAESLQHLKDYMYLGVLPEGQWLKPLLALAAIYMMDDLKTACIAKLAATTPPEDLFSLMEFAYDSKMPQLYFAIVQQVPDSVIEKAYRLKKADGSLLRNLGELQDSSPKTS